MRVLIHWHLRKVIIIVAAFIADQFGEVLKGEVPVLFRVIWMKKSFSSIQAVFCALELQLRTKYIPCSYGAFDLMDLMNVRRCGQKAKRISDGDNTLNENKRV